VAEYSVLLVKQLSYRGAEVFVITDGVGGEAAADDPLVFAGKTPQPVHGRWRQAG
jgi:hypothetical protein